MDIHEYQAKQLLSKFGVNIPEVVYQTQEAENILGQQKIVSKPSACWEEKLNWVKFVKVMRVVTTVDKMIGMNIISQTNESGKS